MLQDRQPDQLPAHGQLRTHSQGLQAQLTAHAKVERHCRACLRWGGHVMQLQCSAALGEGGTHELHAAYACCSFNPYQKSIILLAIAWPHISHS